MCPHASTFACPRGKHRVKGAQAEKYSWKHSGVSISKDWPGSVPSEGYSIFDMKKHRGIKYLIILYWKEMVLKGV